MSLSEETEFFNPEAAGMVEEEEEDDSHDSDLGDDGVVEGSPSEEEDVDGEEVDGYIDKPQTPNRKDGQMIESYDKRELITAMGNVKTSEDFVDKMATPKKEILMGQPCGDPNLEPHEGMEFKSEEDARIFYYQYAKDSSFTVRISKCRRARDGSIICRRFVCSKEGFYVRKYGRTKRSRALTRVGCMARLVVKKLDSGAWVVANFDREHNHPPFVEGNELSYQPPKPTRRTNRGARATLDASFESTTLNSCEQNIVQKTQNSITWRFNKLHQEGFKFAKEGASSIEIFNVAILALQEATRKVIAAKQCVLRAPQVGSVAGEGNQGVEASKLLLATNSGNETTSNPQSSDEVGQGASQGGLMFIQQPLNLVLIAPSMQNESGHSSLAISVPNSQAVQGSCHNQPLNITLPVSVHKEETLDVNDLAGPDISIGRKRKQRSGDDGREHLGGSTTPSQGWNIIAGSNTGSNGNSTSVALSDAQVAALQAVAEAFNVPSAGTTSSSAVPIKVSPVYAEKSKVNKRPVPMPQEAPRTPSGPNPMVHAAAIAAGARIASPAVAASLIKAVQSRTAVHIRSGGSIPKLPNKCAESVVSSSPGNPHPANVHFIQTGESPFSPVNTGMLPYNREANMTEVPVMQTTMDGQIDTLNSQACEDQMMGHYQINDENDIVEQLYAGSSSS